MGSLFLELSKQRSLLKMMEERGFTLCQQNGQRTYGGPPPNWGSRPPPSRDCEVFIGRLPRMCFEDELIPLFLTAGELYEFRLMLDFSGTNRGYGYAHYATPEGAAKAIETLNKYEIRPGHQIGVLKSKNNCRLLFGNIAPSLTFDAFSKFIRTVTDQVLNVLMFRSFQQLKATDFSISSEMEEAFLGRVPLNNRNNQFAIVEYENHKAAAVARRVLIPKYGHILAIDWAVPPRERKRFVVGNCNQTPVVERPLANSALKDSVVMSPSKMISKTRPVPVLIVQPSILENVSFMPKFFSTVVKFFKYLLSVCLYKSVDQLEIPLFICKEIERKIVDRITNLENCSQAVILIFNYFSWYNEKKRFIISSEVQALMEEVKAYSDLFVQFVTKKVKYGVGSSPEEDNYYINVLPLHLNVLFRIILRLDGELQAEPCAGIEKGLKWLSLMIENEEMKDFINEIFNLVESEDAASLDRASNIAKSVLLNTVTTYSQCERFVDNVYADLVAPNNMMTKNFGRAITYQMPDSVIGLENVNVINTQQPSPKIIYPKNSSTDLHHLKVDIGPYKNTAITQLGRYEGTSGNYPPVPLLLVQPSLINNTTFFPKTFDGILIFFKHLLKLAVTATAGQMKMPQFICLELERKIIDRISDMENCVEGVQLILNYFSVWLVKRACTINTELHKLLHEIQGYADSFVKFTWSKTLSGYMPNPDSEKYFYDILPIRLNILFQIMIIFNMNSPVRLLTGISKGLNWVEDLILYGDKTVKNFLEELRLFILEPNPNSQERIRILGKAFYAEIMSSNGQFITYPDIIFPFLSEIKNNNKSFSPLSCSSSSLSSSSSSTVKSENTVVGASEFEA